MVKPNFTCKTLSQRGFHEVTMRLFSGPVTGVTVIVRSLYNYDTAATVICGSCKA